MTDGPMTAQQRETVRRQARARALRMGLSVVPEEEVRAQGDADILGETLTRHPGVLRAMLSTGRLPRAKHAAARRFLADLASQTPNDGTEPEDAA